jgi:hydroxyacylglutathione hydrolase
MELLPGLHRVDGTVANNVYLIENRHLSLVDTGLPGNCRAIFRYIQNLRRQPEEIETIIVTHHHPDHIGSLAALVRRTAAQVWAHRDDVPFIEGTLPPWKEESTLGHRLLLSVAHYGFRVRPVAVNRALDESDWIDTWGGMRVLHTPGHTPGSLCLYSQEKKALFCGDTIQFSLGRIRRPLPLYSWNHERETESIRRIAQLDYDILLPGDGQIVLRGADHLVRQSLPALG